MRSWPPAGPASTKNGTVPPLGGVGRLRVQRRRRGYRRGERVDRHGGALGRAVHPRLFLDRRGRRGPVPGLIAGWRGLIAGWRGLIAGWRGLIAGWRGLI